MLQVLDDAVVDFDDDDDDSDEHECFDFAYEILHSSFDHLLEQLLVLMLVFLLEVVDWSPKEEPGLGFPKTPLHW